MCDNLRMHNEANLILSDAEIQGVRNCGGAAFIGVIFASGPKGGRYAPLRTKVWRTEELAQRELDAVRIKRGLLVSRREVVIIDAKKEQVV
jgi:hypothetical protein